MTQEKSAIMQMLAGERGNFDRIPRSDEYIKALDDLVKKVNEFKEQLADNPKLLEKFYELQDANGLESAISVGEIYKEGFSFGLALGQEVFSK